MPKTLVWADSERRPVPCRGCDAPIEFATNVKSGKAIPFNAPIVALRTEHVDGRLAEEVDLETNHFATCSKVKDFRR